MNFSLAQCNDAATNPKTRAQTRARNRIAAAKRSGVYITADDVSAAEEHFMATCDESDSTSLPRQIYVPKTTMEMSVTMLVDHMHFFVLDRVVSLIPSTALNACSMAAMTSAFVFGYNPHIKLT